jgi:uncharacterized protein (DUF2235 family)
MLGRCKAVHLKNSGCWRIRSLSPSSLSQCGIPLFSRSTFGFLHTGLRLSIENGFHAVAIDEHRRAFSPTLWTKRTPQGQDAAAVAPPRPLTSVEQRWFVGAHANVGGGCQSDLLAQIPLRWIEKDDGTHSTVNETIDASVFERWRNVPAYRPPNLRDWAQRHNVNISTLDRAVRADAPQTPAPD